MSLNDADRARTAAEFTANLGASGLDQDALRERTGLDEKRFCAAFDVTEEADPDDVWLVRDTLEAAVTAAGGQLTPFSTLSEQTRETTRGADGEHERP